MFGALAISASGLTAQRLRLDVIAANLANVHTTRTAAGGPYRRRVAVLAERPLDFAAALDQALAGQAAPPGAGTAALGAGMAPGAAAGGLQGGGVAVVELATDPSPFKLVHDPGHPDAGPDGMVRLPNVDVLTEMVDLMAATRAYEANATAFQAAKALLLKTLEMGR